MKKSLLTLCLLLCGTPLLAQSLSAEEVLENTAYSFKKAGGIRARYKASTGAESIIGVILYQDNKFYLETDGCKTWFDGKTQWSLMEQTGEVTVSEPTAEELQAINPYAWLELYTKGYNLKQGTPRAKDEYQVIMTTNQPRQDMQSMVLTVNKSTFLPKRISMAGRGGKDVALITILDYTTGNRFDDNTFVFDPKAYPKAEVIDLR